MGIKKGAKINRGIKLDVKLFKKNFTVFRVDKGLTIQGACKLVGTSQVIYNRILRGEKVDPATIVKFRKFIKIYLELD